MNRENMIAYLLHKGSEAELDAFEDLWISDDEIYAELQEVEAELLDAYAKGAVAAQDRERIEKYLLVSPQQHRKLLFARMLTKALPDGRRSRPAPWLAAAAALIVMLAGAAVWLAIQNASLRRELAGRPASTPAAQSTPINAEPVYVAEISSDTAKRSASNLTEVRPPVGFQVLRLDLQVDPEDAALNLSATVRQNGRSVWQEQPVRAERRPYGFAAPVWVPAAQLGPGDYEIELSSAGRPVNAFIFKLVTR
jgi:hypothetical protein